MSPAQHILSFFAAHGVQSGGRIHKRQILDAIKQSGMDMAAVRGAWHQLIGEGLIRQLGEELELTARGAQLLESQK